MEENTEENMYIMLRILFVLVILFVVFLFFRTCKVSLSYDFVCKYNYGSNYISEFDDDFGRYCIELVYENLTKRNPKPYNWTIEEVHKICGSPSFFDFTRWNCERCNGEYKND